jgi:hypothetical protein
VAPEVKFPLRFAALCACLMLAGCYVGAEEAGRRLERELPQRYPDQIAAASFEFAPPLDPPNIFIDFVPSMSLAEQQRFLCEELFPLVKAAYSGMAINNEESAAHCD